jgi:hypothetical protein
MSLALPYQCEHCSSSLRCFQNCPTITANTDVILKSSIYMYLNFVSKGQERIYLSSLWKLAVHNLTTYYLSNHQHTTCYLWSEVKSSEQNVVMCLQLCNIVTEHEISTHDVQVPVVVGGGGSIFCDFYVHSKFPKTGHNEMQCNSMPESGKRPKISLYTAGGCMQVIQSAWRHLVPLVSKLHCSIIFITPEHCEG